MNKRYIELIRNYYNDETIREKKKIIIIGKIPK